LVDVQHLRRRRPRFRAARAAGHLRALRRRLERRHPPAGLARHDVPPHRRPQLDGDRDRARRLQRRAGARRRPPDVLEPPPRALAAMPLQYPDSRRDRPRREPVEPLPPRGRALLANPDPLGLRPPRHADLPHAPAQVGRLLMTSESISRVGVVGAGFMGSGIAESAASAGIDVTVFEPEPAPLTRSRERLAVSVDRAVSRGKLTAEDAEGLTGRIAYTTEFDDLAG